MQPAKFAPQSRPPPPTPPDGPHPTSSPAASTFPPRSRPFISAWSHPSTPYVVRDTAADHPGLTAPARIIGMRSQGEAEIAIEQDETRYEGVTWTTPAKSRPIN
jgi:hypothetical protein